MQGGEVQGRNVRDTERYSADSGSGGDQRLWLVLLPCKRTESMKDDTYPPIPQYDSSMDCWITTAPWLWYCISGSRDI